jgi:phosphonate transport system ATP-binding protein
LTVLISLHQIEYALKYCPRTVALKGGRVVYDGPSAEITQALLTDIYGAELEDLLPGASANEPVPFPVRMPSEKPVFAAKRPVGEIERLRA